MKYKPVKPFDYLDRSQWKNWYAYFQQRPHHFADLFKVEMTIDNMRTIFLDLMERDAQKNQRLIF